MGVRSGKIRGKNREYLDAYFELMTINGSTRVFQTAYKLGIFKVFKQGPQSAEVVASNLVYDRKTVELILDALVALKLFDKKNNLYTPSPTLALLKGDYENLSSDYWDYLPELVRTGQPMKKMNDAFRSEAEYEKQVSSLDWMMSPSAFELVSLLEIGGSRKKLNILDVGAGSGVWSLPILMRDSTSKVTLLDWKNVLKVAKEKVTEKGVASRVSFLEGDFFSIDIPGTFDLILVGNVLHTQNEDKNLELLNRLKPVLAEGGELVIVDVLTENTDLQLSRILYEIGLKLRTESGQVYELSQITDLLIRAGFRKPEVVYLSSSPPHIMGACIAVSMEASL